MSSLLFFLLTLLVLVLVPSMGSSEEVVGECALVGASLRAVSWNLAAVNNNPFEYWLSVGPEHAAYARLMAGVAAIIREPGEADVEVASVFSRTMASELGEVMGGLGWSGVEETMARFEKDFAGRRIVTGFMHDEEIGAKRLTSMPDRISNTIDVVDGAQVFRPTVINCYKGRFASKADWWEQWKAFMFKEKIAVLQKGKVVSTSVVEMLQPIRKAKYPAITEEEERISMPLQVLSMAIFDAILIHLVDVVARDDWQDARTLICEALNVRKNDRILEILSSDFYRETDVMFLQEVAGAFLQRASAIPHLKETYHMVSPDGVGNRDQISMIFFSKTMFDESTIKEVTSMVTSKLPADAPVEPGDMLAITVKDRSDAKNVWLLASFHGDTNGLATIPVLRALHECMTKDLATENPYLIFGLDANTYEKGKKDKTLGVTEFAEFYRSLGLTSIWGAEPNPKNYTTCNARTYLQPQLNKASTLDEIKTKGDVNPKDFILFSTRQLESSSPYKDNTGRRIYLENHVFPTLEFPSDHGIVGATLASCKL